MSSARLRMLLLFVLSFVTTVTCYSYVDVAENDITDYADQPEDKLLTPYPIKFRNSGADLFFLEPEMNGNDFNTANMEIRKRAKSNSDNEQNLVDNLEKALTDNRKMPIVNLRSMYGLGSGISRKEDRSSERKPGHSLSISAPIEVLRNQFNRVAKERKMEYNRNVMDRDGKRSVPVWIDNEPSDYGNRKAYQQAAPPSEKLFLF